MNNNVSGGFEKRLGDLARQSGSPIAGALKGVEKEALRIDRYGELAQTPHPQALGSALTNRYITTDFSEVLLEFVTPAYTTTWETLRTICDIHQFTYERLGDELLWAASMPCRVPDDAQIPLAEYGSSNVAKMKTAYRRGLGYRYGRHMQTIAGVHFNYSLPETFWPLYQQVLGDGRDGDEFRSDHYLGLVRNFRRFGWLVLYLFGASPALCRCFVREEPAGLVPLGNDSLFAPYATSLRMSDLGYSNQNQSRIVISLNHLDEYIRDLSLAIRTPEPAYRDIGVKVNGEYRQLSANQLQIENEYYSSIRPKRVARSGERPTAALRRGGIEYVEIRSLDVNVFDPAGVNQNTMRFIEAFLVYCLLEQSEPCTTETFLEANRNQTLAARSGRQPGLELARDGRQVLLTDWAREIVARVAEVAELIDRGDGTSAYREAAKLMQAAVEEPELTPSARMLAEMHDFDDSFFEFVMQASRGHRDYFASIAPIPEARNRQLEGEARDSLARQADIEASDTLHFDDYLARYFATD